MAVVLIGTSCMACSTLFKGKDQTIRQDDVLPHDREHIAKQAELKTYTADDIRKGIVAGDWTIETVNGQQAKGQTTPFLKFVPADGHVYGNNGCNALSGPYTFNAADSTISFGQMLSTMMLCSESGITDVEINVALSEVKFYTTKESDSEYWLYLYDSGRRELMSLLHQNFDFLNGTWQVTAIGDKTIDNPDVRMVIDVDESKVHGNTGCNIFNGAFDTNMEAPNSISFSDIRTTRMACPESVDYEAALIVALEESTVARPVSATEVRLYDSRSKETLILRRS